eukprot:TRINITY_DN34333_c0_g1_i1.p1 TRINITY_DN34333_c0_g1~~TRINITY_DN34333_c0_g1_i1.p1  ORF type:complete len:111 (-),score=23.74 TRINITY_DN34333_c0_g1_i1:71-403(-)
MEVTPSILVVSLLVGLVQGQCEISVKNVGQKDFTWHIEYAGDWIHEKNLTLGQHDNYDCACVPHDMKILYQDYYCYHYMNCINGFDYEVDITDYAIYINVGHDNVEICPL